MARKTAAFTRFKVPYLREKDIEAEAQLLLDEYLQSGKWQGAAPVPVEDIIELHLRLAFEIADLRALLLVDDVLGAIWFTGKEVRVDVRLDPSADPALLGRYKFTLAHEAGHWRLHRAYFQDDPSQAKLFDGRGPPAFICRSSEKPPEEWQADFFASCMLMPRATVRSAWHDWHGSLDPVAVQELTAVAVRADAKRNENIAMERFCRPLADRFEVSAEAMRIRLEKIGFLVRDVPNTLF